MAEKGETAGPETAEAKDALLDRLEGELHEDVALDELDRRSRAVLSVLKARQALRDFRPATSSPGDATYANYREANAAFWRGTVIPLVRKTAGALTGWLGQRYGDLRIEPDLETVPALQAERDALWARLGAASFLTEEERRRMAGVEG